MALIKCQECSKQISDKAKECPGCGHPITMKCPKCKVDQPYDETCKNCGIIIAKYKPKPPPPIPDTTEKSHPFFTKKLGKKEARSFIIAALIVFVGFFGFQNCQNTKVEKAVQLEREIQEYKVEDKRKKVTLSNINPASAIELQFNLQFKESDNGMILYGKTNLPNGTKLGASVKKDGSDGVGAQDFKIYVKDGFFSSSQFADRGAPLLGEYEISLFTYFNKSWQKSIVLDKLMNYTGGQIKNNKLEIISKRIFGKNLSRKSRTKINQSRKSARLDFASASALARDLLNKGLGMEKLRNRVEMQNCMNKMRRLQPEVKRLQQRIKSLLQNHKTFFLDVAATHLDLCVSCSKDLALKNCISADEYLSKAK